MSDQLTQSEINQLRELLKRFTKKEESINDVYRRVNKQNAKKK